jgi:hypothetical protein
MRPERTMMDRGIDGWGIEPNELTAVKGVVVAWNL